MIELVVGHKMMSIKRNTNTSNLFLKDKGQDSLFDKSLLDENEEEKPVECLGMTFLNDEERRNYFLDILRVKLKDPEFRKIEGFPIGEDEDILALSDPPYYTVCPNPFLSEFVEYYQKTGDHYNSYQQKPYTGDVTEGKHHAVYKVHSYHTKIPHKAIMKYILHYTQPGDFVLDGFSGTGMTGFASIMCGSPDLTLQAEISKEFKEVKWGARIPLLNDLAIAASFLSFNHISSFNHAKFLTIANKILDDIENKYGWMYSTRIDPSTDAKIVYTTWSDLFICPTCTNNFRFWDAAIGDGDSVVKSDLICPNCKSQLSKRDLEPVWETTLDLATMQPRKSIRQEPIQILAEIARGKRLEKDVSKYDWELLEKINKIELDYWIPSEKLPDGDNTEQPKNSHNATHIHHFYTKRSLILFTKYFHLIQQIDDVRIRNLLIFLFTSCYRRNSKRTAWHKLRFGQASMMGTLYIPALTVENNMFSLMRTKLKQISSGLREISDIHSPFIISACSTENLDIPNESIDYIFTDPPFGSNINYSELNFMWEAWIKVFSNNKREAIVNKSQKKELNDYQLLMENCFSEYFRVLKSGRWMTVVFHNSKNAVWNAISESLQKSGFIIADVRTLDKKQSSFKQIVSSSAVKQDLVISVYKPTTQFNQQFHNDAGSEQGVWDFVESHLSKLPVFVKKDGKVEIIAERQNFLLYDRMVAFHVQKGISIPLSASNFYQGLSQRYLERDGMFFLSEQAIEYDKKRMTVEEVEQLQLFVTDEGTAIQWLKQILLKKPQAFHEIHPLFMKEISGWHKYERSLELLDILEQNFLRYDGKGEVPSQIHSYLSTNFKELRNLPKDSPSLQSKAKDRWYVPDPNKLGDLEKIRERSLLREFQEYKESTQKRLKVFRLEAVRAGFKKSWQERDYATIIAVANKIPDNILQDDPKLIMWYDQAMTRSGEDA